MRFIFFVVILCSCFSGCGVRTKTMVWNNIAEIVDFVVCGEKNDMSISLMCGRREVLYSLDGVATELIPYGIITVCVPNNMQVDNIEYVLFVGVNKYNGSMQKNPYNNTWVADIKTAVNQNDNISIDIYLDDNKYSTKLNRVDQDWVVSSNEIVDNILLSKYKQQVGKFIVDNEFAGEVYVKLINDDTYSNWFYYYLSIQGKDGSNMSVLISPETAEILASNCVECDE